MNSRIYIPVEQLLSVYVEIMMNWDVVHQQMQKPDGILEQWIWWPFWWFAQIGQPAATIYQWIKTKLEEFALRNEEGDQIKRIYLKAGFYYLVREYLPSHRSQIA